ncbi:MAG: hypothetical protein IPL40_12500 [Proteobacteria bacterium]|nr:hypothetical protein [Pseudomonadota bacterium]
MAYCTIVTLARSLILLLGMALLTAVGLRSTALRPAFVPRVEWRSLTMPSALAEAPRSPWYALLSRGMRGWRPLRRHASSAPSAVSAERARSGQPVLVALPSRHLMPSLRPWDEGRLEGAPEQRPLDAAPPAPVLPPLLPTGDPLLRAAMAGVTGLPPSCGLPGCLLRHLRRPLDGGIDGGIDAQIAIGGASARRALPHRPSAGPWGERAESDPTTVDGSAPGLLSALFVDQQPADNSLAGASGGARALLRAQIGGATWRSRAQAIHSL